jgi:hypothetical protein
MNDIQAKLLKKHSFPFDEIIHEQQQNMCDVLPSACAAAPATRAARGGGRGSCLSTAASFSAPMGPSSFLTSTLLNVDYVDIGRTPTLTHGCNIQTAPAAPHHLSNIITNKSTNLFFNK